MSLDPVTESVGRFPIKFKTVIMYLKIGGYLSYKIIKSTLNL